MKPLKALINKNNLNKFHRAGKKDELKDGDVILTDNGLFLIYFSKNIIDKKFPLLVSTYGYETKADDGLFIKPTSPSRSGSDYKYSFNYIEGVEYDNDLKRESNHKNDVIKIYKNAIDIVHLHWDDIYLDYTDFVAKNK